MDGYLHQHRHKRDLQEHPCGRVASHTHPRELASSAEVGWPSEHHRGRDGGSNTTVANPPPRTTAPSRIHRRSCQTKAPTHQKEADAQDKSAKPQTRTNAAERAWLGSWAGGADAERRTSPKPSASNWQPTARTGAARKPWRLSTTCYTIRARPNQQAGRAASHAGATRER